MKEFLVAVDGGGSKTEYLLTDLTGQVIRQSSGAPTSITGYGLGPAAYNLREGLRQLLEHETEELTIVKLVMAVAGLDTRHDFAGARQVFGEMVRDWSVGELVLVNDAVAALENGTPDRPAIVLVAGTGANCLGQDATGRTVRVSGLDYLLADDGSGYDAGRLALKAAVRAADGRGQPTRLQEKIFAHFEVGSVGELKDIVYSPALSKDEIASFAKICLSLRDEGDAVAGQIIDYCQSQLLLDVKAVATQLHLADLPFTLVLTGTFLHSFATEFEQLVTKQFPQATIAHPDRPPVFGALAIAQKIHAGAKAAEFETFA